MLHHDHQKKKSFYHLYDSDLASWNIVFYIRFGTSKERAAEGKEESASSYVLAHPNCSDNQKARLLENKLSSHRPFNLLLNYMDKAT